MHILHETFSADDLFDFQILQICLIYKPNLTSDQIRPRIIHLPIFSTWSIKSTPFNGKTFSSVNDVNSQWICANAGRIVNQKICKLYCYANFVTITVGKGVASKFIFPAEPEIETLEIGGYVR